MKLSEAYSVSIGVLGSLDTYLTAEVFPLPLWVTFIGCASFFAAGAGVAGWLRALASNAVGIALGSLALLAVASLERDPPLALALLAGSTAVLALAARLGHQPLEPAHAWGVVALGLTALASDHPIAELDLHHPALVAAQAVAIGASFGLAAELWARAMTSDSAVELAPPVGFGDESESC